jgi:protein SCO1/2
MIRTLTLVLLLTFSVNLPAFELLQQQDNSQAADSGAHQFEFRFPDMTLVDHNNQPVALGDVFGHDDNVVFAFFFTHCVSVCTTLTHTLKNLQPLLPADTRIAMISIDPETDTPALLTDYIAEQQIDMANWKLLTGNNADIVALQKSFEAYRGNKMNHTISLFLKKSGSDMIMEIRKDFAGIPGLMTRG